MSECERNLSHLVQLYSEMRIHYNRVAKFFSEDPAATHIDEFFGSFATFVVDFEVHMRICYIIINVHVHVHVHEVYSVA